MESQEEVKYNEQLAKQLIKNNQLDVEAFNAYTHDKTPSETCEVIKSIVKGRTARPDAIKFINQAFQINLKFKVTMSMDTIMNQVSDILQKSQLRVSKTQKAFYEVLNNDLPEEEKKQVECFEYKSKQNYQGDITYKFRVSMKDIPGAVSGVYKIISQLSNRTVEPLKNALTHFMIDIIDPFIRVKIQELINNNEHPPLCVYLGGGDKKIGSRWYPYAETITEPTYQYNENHQPFTKEILDKLIYQLQMYDAMGYDMFEMIFDSITFQYTKEYKERYGAAIKDQNELFHEYLSIDTVSKTNCAFTGLLLSSRWDQYYKNTKKDLQDLKEKDYLFALFTCPQKRMEMTWKYKNQNHLSEYKERTICIEELDEIAQRLNINYRCVDESAEEMSSKHSCDNWSTAQILAKQRHIVPLIPKKELIEIYGKTVINKLTGITQEQHLKKIEKKPKPISPITKLNQERNPKIATWDVETYTPFTTPTVYLSGLSYMKDGQIVHQQFKGDNRNLQRFFMYISDNSEYFDKYIFYAHNGGRFDLNLLMRDTLGKRKDIIFGKCTELNGTWLSVNIMFFKKVIENGSEKTKVYTIEFRDSYRLFLSSLADVTKDLCKKNIKTHLEHRIINILTHKLMTKYQLKEVPKSGLLQEYSFENNEDALKLKEFMDKAEPYHRLDCDGLLEALLTFNNIMVDSFQIDITNAQTISGLVKKLYRYKWYPETGKIIFNLTKRQDEFIRKSFRGGMSLCRYLGTVQQTKLYYFDFTSFYPYTGTMLLPFGEGKDVDFGQGISVTQLKMILQKQKKMGGFFTCLVKGTKQMLATKGVNQPFLSIMTDEGLIYPYFNDYQELVLPFPSIIYAQERCGYDIKVINGIVYEVSPILANMFKDLFKLKEQATKDNNNSLVTTSKVLINSGYGVWAFDQQRSTKIEMIKPGSRTLELLLATGRVENIVKWKRNIVVQTQNEYSGSADVNVAIASYITAYARKILHECITDIERKGGKVYYCDTDSVITDYDILADTELQQSYIPDLTGEELGSMKSERGNISQYQSKHYDTFIGAGSKMYYCADLGYFETVYNQVPPEIMVYKTDNIIITSTPFKFENTNLDDKELYCYRTTQDQKYINEICYRYNVPLNLDLFADGLFTTACELPQGLDHIEQLYIYIIKGRKDIKKDKPLFKKLKGINQNNTNKIVDFEIFKSLAVAPEDRTEKEQDDIHTLTLRTMQISCSKSTYCLDPDNPDVFKMVIDDNLYKKFQQTATRKGTVETTNQFIEPPVYPLE